MDASERKCKEKHPFGLTYKRPKKLTLPKHAWHTHWLLMAKQFMSLLKEAHTVAADLLLSYMFFKMYAMSECCGS